MESYLQDSLERISAASYVRTFDNHVAFTETLQQRVTFTATVHLRGVTFRAMYYVGILIQLPCRYVTFCCVILAKRCYTRKVYALHTLIYYILLVISRSHNGPHSTYCTSNAWVLLVPHAPDICIIIHPSWLAYESDSAVCP